MSNGLTVEIRYIILRNFQDLIWIEYDLNRKWPLESLKKIGLELTEKSPKIMIMILKQTYFSILRVKAAWLRRERLFSRPIPLLSVPRRDPWETGGLIGTASIVPPHKYQKDFQASLTRRLTPQNLSNTFGGQGNIPLKIKIILTSSHYIRKDKMVLTSLKVYSFSPNFFVSFW